MTDCPEVAAVRRAVATLNAGDVEGYLTGFSANSLRWVDGLDSPLAVADTRDNLTELTSAFQDLHLDEVLLFGGQGHACALWILRGTHPGVYGGIEPTYRDIAVQTCEVYTFSETTISQSHVFGDALGLFTQIT